MSYNKQTWDTSSYVNPTRMNHIEEGIEEVSNAIDNLDATNIPYDSNTSVKEKIDSIANYSSTEKVVGEWIDGKPIYQKTVYFGALPNNTSKSVAHNVSNIKLWVDLCCVVTRSSDKVALFLPLVNTINTIAYFSVTGNDIVIITNGNLSAYDDCYVTLKYTKTTD